MKFKSYIYIVIIFLAVINLYNFTKAIDEQPPVTTKEFEGKYFVRDDIEWVGPSTIAWLNATDDSSGVKYLHYEIWNDSDGDYIFDTLVVNKIVYDNTADDLNPATGVISVKIFFDKECLHRLSYYAVDNANNVEPHGSILVEEWHYEFQPNSVYTPDRLIFASSPAIGNLLENENLEIVTGSDEVQNFFPELNATARGIWRCFYSNGEIAWALDTKTEESRSSPAIADLDGDGYEEIIGGTTSGWLLEVISHNGSFIWTFPVAPNGPVTGGLYVWHSSPAIADLNEEVGGLEVVIGNNPYMNVWCFDGDNSDGIDEGITINKNYYPDYPYSLGAEGIDWDVLWVFNTSGIILATPAIDDVDNDGVLEVVIGSEDGNLYVIDGRNGNLEWSYSTGGAIYASAAVGDIDNDSYKEILIGSTDGKLYCLQWNGLVGNLEWSFSTGNAIYSSAAIGDINGDGEYEIVFSSLDYYLYCLDSNGNQLWKCIVGRSYASPALMRETIKKNTIEWQMFRKNAMRNGFYEEKGIPMRIYVATENNRILEINKNGFIIHKFIVNGRIRSSPAIGDVDGDRLLNIVFYDWGGLDYNDTFWCLERRYLNTNFIGVDSTPPETVKEVCSDDEYNITADVPIWLNATDAGNDSSGVEYLHYEIWYDSNGDEFVDALAVSETVYDNETGDLNPARGEVSVLIYLIHKGINEIRWYAEDYLGNREQMHYQQHKVIIYAPHLSITKEDSNDPVHPGDFLNYTINITNIGNANATGIIVKDLFDSNVTFISCNPPYDLPYEWHISKLEPNESFLINIKVQVKKPLENIILHNYANVTCNEGEYNETTEDTQVISAPNLTITKEAIDLNGLPLEPGDKIHYIINIENNGDKNHKDNAGNELEDFIPEHTTYEENSLKANKGIAQIIGNKIIWNGEINVSETITIEFNVTVDFPLDNGTLISNEAKLYWDSDGNNVNDKYSYAYANLSIVSSPKLIITKEDSNDPVHPGDFLNYTINITNIGNANATGIIVKDLFDSNVTFISCNPPYDLPYEWHISKLEPNECFLINIKVQVKKPLENIILHNYANVTCNEGEYNETTEDTQVISAPNLTITKEAIDLNGLPLEPGDKIHYIINIENNGDKNHKDNAGNELEDFIPEHTTYEENSLKANKGIAQIIGNKIIWNGEINVSETITIEFNVTVDFPLDNGTLISNEAKLYWDSDGNNVNDKYSYAYANLSIVSSPKLIITKEDSNDPVHPGDFLNYTINITNIGNANATGIIVKDLFDSNVTFISCNPPYDLPYEWHISKLEPNECFLINIKVQVKKPLENIILHNYANVTCNEGEYNETTEDTQVASPVLIIYKESVPAVAEPNSTLLYRIRVENVGLANATNVVIKDVYDEKVNVVSAMPAGINNEEWHIAMLDVGDFYEIEILVEVLAEEGDIIVNYANVTCDEEAYDEIEITTPVISYPPETYKKFNGIVVNKTWVYDGVYTLHYILNTTTIELVAEDNGSGVAKTFYRIFKLEDNKWIEIFGWQEYGVWNAYPPYYPINLAELALLYNLSPCGKFEIEFYSIDKAGNVEDIKWNDVFVDCFVPISQIKKIVPYEIMGNKVNISVNASDEGVGIEKIELYYRYSPDNLTWTNWTLYATKDSNFTIQFVANKSGYYQFYSIAYDKLGNHEVLQETPKAICKLGNPYDLNDDGRVNIEDLRIIINHWMQTPEDPEWDERADVNKDDIINISDLLLVIDHWTG